MSTLATVLLLAFCIGTLLAFAASLTEIYRKRNRELAELVESKRFYLTLIDNNIDILAVADAEGRVRFINRAFQDTLGYSRDYAEHMHITDPIHPDDKEQFLAEWQQLITTQEPILFTPFRVRSANGEDRWKQVVGRNMLDDPDMRGAILSSSDITKLIDAMDALRRTEQRIRIALTGADITVFNIDLQGRLTWMFNSLIDQPPEEMLGKTVHDYLPADIANRLAALRQKVITEGGHESEEIDFVINGTRRVLSIHYEQLLGPDGQVIGLVGAATDMTKLRVVADQMAVSQRMEAIGKLTGGIAHDFNNLLTVIVGNLELLKDHLTRNPQLEHFVDLALTAADRGAGLTRSLLAFARKQSLEIKSVDTNKVIAEIAELLRRSLPPSIQLHFHADEQAWPCRADAGQLQNAIINLVVNARDAMPDGGTITISTSNIRLDHHADTPVPPDVAPGAYVRICVEDTGTGMTPEVLERVYEPFFTTKPQGKGSGLGLSTVYGFAKQLNGHLHIDSAPGKGTKVCLYVPRDEMNAPTASNRRPNVPPATGATILVVDDDEDIRQLTAALLQRAGYQTLEADNGESALALLHDNPSINLLLTDMLLGSGPSGLSLIKTVQSRYPGLPVVLMSGYIDPTSAEGMAKEIDVPQLRKPFRRQELEAMVNDVLATASHSPSDKPRAYPDPDPRSGPPGSDSITS